MAVPLNPCFLMRSVFDIIGPPMIGPSSSHTAGAVRIGLMARQMLGGPPVKAEIGLHGSFAATGQGHATDRGIVAGLLGWAPDDERLKDALKAAASAGLQVEFRKVDLGESVHPNSAILKVTASNSLSIVASSIGGGGIQIVSIDEFDMCFSGTLDTLLFWHEDRPGFLAHVTAVLACISANIATIHTARTQRGAHALTVIELDAPPNHDAVALLGHIDHVRILRVLSPLP